MAFSDKRVPATRMGSGTGRNMSRMRRHIDKGFYDPAPPASGETAVNAISSFPPSNSQWFNVWERDLSGNASTGSLSGPDFSGQILILSLNNANGFSWTIGGAFYEGTSSYSQIVLNADGENVFMVGLKRAGSLVWYIMKNHGGALS